MRFDSAPFPFRGTEARSGSPFLNVSSHGRRGHRTWSGQVYWEDETYNDPHVLLHIPRGFDIHRPAVMVLFFHGHGATLERDILARQQVPAQISESGVNAVLVAPQLAVDARDSSVGKLGEPGGLDRFMQETSTQLAKLHGDPRSKAAFASMPVVIIAYSGGYVGAASCLSGASLTGRLKGIVLLDALYGEMDKFSTWITKHNHAFFVSAYANSTRSHNAELKDILQNRDVSFGTKLQPRLKYGSVTFISTSPDTAHRDFVTQAWVAHPIQDILTRLAANAG